MGTFIVLGKKMDHLIEGFGVNSNESNIMYISGISQTNVNIINYKLWHFLNRISPKLAFLWANYMVFPFIIPINKIEQRQAVYVIVLTSWFEFLENGYDNYLRKKNSNIKLIGLFTDNAKKYEWIDVDNLFWSDWTITFNPIDVIEKKWGLFLSINTKILKEEINDTIPECDIFFCGVAKNRLKKIHDAYIYFSKMGLKCKFFIVNVPEEMQLKESNIVYNQMLTYKEVQNWSARAKCILEITDSRADGFTYRMGEALMYNKKIITNVDFIKHFDYYNPDMIFCYNTIEEVTKEWVQKEVDIEYGFDEDISQTELIKLIDNHFGKRQFPCTKWQEHGDEYIEKLCQI